MALRIAVQNYPSEPEAAPLAGPLADARARGARLESYLALDPAIRFLIALALVAAISLLYLVQASSVTELNYDVQRLDGAHTQLIRDRQDLDLQIARAQSLPQIEQIARDKLHMVPLGDGVRYLPLPPESGAQPTGR
ncbi:MAG: hypothetical protein ACR2M0_12150 [Chloroflexia bacterium]